jgi:hypothetical protein
MKKNSPVEVFTMKSIFKTSNLTTLHGIKYTLMCCTVKVVKECQSFWEIM